MESQEHLESLIEANKKRLQVLEVQLATFGSKNAPAHIIVEINTLKQEIKSLENQVLRNYKPANSSNEQASATLPTNKDDSSDFTINTSVFKQQIQRLIDLSESSFSSIRGRQTLNRIENSYHNKHYETNYVLDGSHKAHIENRVGMILFIPLAKYWVYSCEYYSGTSINEATKVCEVVRQNVIAASPVDWTILEKRDNSDVVSRINYDKKSIFMVVGIELKNITYTVYFDLNQEKSRFTPPST